MSKEEDLNSFPQDLTTALHLSCMCHGCDYWSALLCMFSKAAVRPAFPMVMLGCWVEFLPKLLPWQHGLGNGKCTFTRVSFFFCIPLLREGILSELHNIHLMLFPSDLRLHRMVPKDLKTRRKVVMVDVNAK